jgi:hypothetical protein
MPVTAMNENQFALRLKDKVGLTRKTLSMKPVTVAKAESELSDNQLRFSVFAPDF